MDNRDTWTLDSLKEHLESLLDALCRHVEDKFSLQERAVLSALAAQEKAVSAALVAADRAVAKAELANERRFESVNEFRSQLRDQAETLMPRGETSALLKASDERFYALLERVAVIDKRVTELAAAAVARRGGLTDSWGTLVGLVGMLAAGGSIIVMILRH